MFHTASLHDLNPPPPLIPQSDMKPDDLLLKGPKTRERNKEKKSSKDKKKGQAADGAEKRQAKAKVDELLVSVIHTLIQINH